jgi:polysaccharide export outer membrane protein
MARKNQQRLRELIIYLSFVLLVTSSCVSTKKTSYFPQLANDTLSASNIAPQTYIQRNDLLSISITSKNPEASFVFNRPNEMGASSQNTITGGYLVNNDGYIQFPFFGTIKCIGLTKDQLKDKLTKELTDRALLIDPVVIIRFMNFRVTVLGEVGKPAVLPIANERISLLEALGLAGDITIYGRKDNVLLIREENGVKITRRINLNSSDFLTSDVYYLKSNDLVYVEANKNKVAAASKTAQIAPIVLGGLALLVVLADNLNN